MIALLNKNEENVKEIFKVISTKYDLIDSIMSFGMDTYWRKKLIESLKLKDGHDILDVGCGSGKISYSIENEIRADHIYAMDITKEMFPFNKGSKVQFIEGSAMSIPLEDKCVDRVVSGFLTRNVPSLETYIGEVYRVLKPGGIFCNLDIFDPQKALIAPLFRIYFYKIVPIIFDKMSGTESYSYLARSVQTFVSPPSLNTILLKAGFSEVTFKRMAGGTVFIHTAIK
jgi:demethylmenaquinone methyltransferase/2-methoxy-6-polyprenyl-1,4-benzoquinol methylase